MKYFTCFLLIISFAGITQLLADHHKKEESNLKLPTSWKEYLSMKRKQKAFGVWSFKGKTTSIWEGIPEGLDYTDTFTSQMSADGSKILTSHVMKTIDGNILSTGSGMETWDVKRKKIFSSHSGFDGGKLYTGPSELIGISEIEEKWKYTETISGKTYEVIITRKSEGPDKRSQTNVRVDDPDNSATTTFTRQPRKQRPANQGVILKKGPKFKEQEKVLHAFVNAFIEGNAEDCANLYTKDTTYMIPETSVLKGRADVLKSYKEFFKTRDYEILEMKEPVSEVINFGNWAVIRGTGMDKTRSKKGEESTKNYKWMILSQKQKDGSWKMKWDIFNYDNAY